VPCGGRVQGRDPLQISPSEARIQPELLTRIAPASEVDYREWRLVVSAQRTKVCTVAPLWAWWKSLCVVYYFELSKASDLVLKFVHEAKTRTDRKALILVRVGKLKTCYERRLGRLSRLRDRNIRWDIIIVVVISTT
jgi:hypothetical protein